MFGARVEVCSPGRERKETGKAMVKLWESWRTGGMSDVMRTGAELFGF